MTEESSIASIGTLRFSGLAPVTGRGARLIERDGRELIDLSAGWGAASLGYAHPAVLEAIADAAGRMPGVSALSQSNDDAEELARDLAQLVPGDAARSVYLGLAGTDANAAALTSAVAFTGRGGIVTFRHSYHGGIGISQAVSGVHVAAGVDAMPGAAFLDYPRTDLSAVRRDLDAAIGASPPAAVIVEPLMSDGGVIVPPPGFLRLIRDWCSEHDVVMICDEVKVGCGRTGRMFAFEHDEITPDIVTLGKGLGGGVPLSAAVGLSPIMNSAPSAQLMTTAGNPVVCAAGRAVLRTIASDDLVDRADVLGEILQGALSGMRDRLDAISDVRGRGLIAGIELPTDGTFAAKVVARAYEQGAVFFYVGPDSNVLELTPPLIITEEELLAGLEIIEGAIRDVDDGLVSDESIRDFVGW